MKDIDITEVLFGHGSHLNCLQMSTRAFLAFFITLLLLRIAGIRTFGKRSAFDNVIIIMLGSVLSRAVVGASPFIPTTVACLVFVLIHWALAWISQHNDFIGRLVKGEPKQLFAGGRPIQKNMSRSLISEKDLLESLRLRLNQDSFEQVREMFLERNGEISIVKDS
ncbi:MAG TPA: YetF domain-containing protein [Puia sp.]